MNISERAMLVSLSIKGVWSAVAEDERISQEVAQRYAVSAEVGRYMKKICDPKKVPSLKKFNSTRNELYNLHRELTLPWDDHGTRLLPAAMYFDYMAKVQAAKTAMEEAYEEFLREIPALKAQARRDLNGLFREEDWPEPDALRRRLSIRIKVMPMADANDFRVKLGAEEEAKIRQQVNQEVFQTLANSLLDLVRRLKTCVEDMHDRIGSYKTDSPVTGKTIKRFTDSAVNNLREMVEIIPKLNVLGSPEIDSLVQEIRNSLCRYDAQDLRDNYLLRRQVVKGAGEVAKKLAAIESVLAANVEAA